jgi:hypothetical protein
VTGPGDDDLLNYAAIAALIGVKVKSVRVARSRGQMPEPDDVSIPDRPRWRRSTIMAWRPRPRPVPAADALTYADIAAMLGVEVDSVKALRKRGRMPEPDEVLATGVPTWHRSTIEVWATNRPKAGRPPRRTDT